MNKSEYLFIVEFFYENCVLYFNFQVYVILELLFANY